jgi:transcriptional regulator with XRE-family HTH domain
VAKATEPAPTTIADEFKALRPRLGLTQQHLGEALGVTRNHVARIECGIRNPGRPLELLLRAVAKRPGTLQR